MPSSASTPTTPRPAFTACPTAALPRPAASTRATAWSPPSATPASRCRSAKSASPTTTRAPAPTVGTSSSASNKPMHDFVIRNGTIYDGSGDAPAIGDLAIDGDTLVAVGGHVAASGRTEIDAAGLAVAPGFINMLSWAGAALLVDGRSQSDIRQGVTLEVMGEGWSGGPLTPEMRAESLATQGDLKYPIPWTTLGEYLDHMVAGGVSTNVASFVGAATVRIHELGRDDRQPTPEELGRMQDLVRGAMEEGAVGVSAALIYVPACFAGTEELIALA